MYALTVLIWPPGFDTRPINPSQGRGDETLQGIGDRFSEL